MCSLNGSDMISMRQIYKNNDPYSLDLWVEIKKLHEFMKIVNYTGVKKSELDLFLQEISDKLWGWVKYEIDKNIHKKMDVLEVTGASGQKADVLNGKYVETD